MIFMSFPGNQQVFQLKDYDFHKAFLPVHQCLGEPLVQNCILLLSKLTSDYWICQERSLIKEIRNLYGESNKRSQTNGSPDSLANSLVIFMSIPGTPEVFQLKDYGLHTTVLPVYQSLGGNNYINMKEVYDVLLVYIPTIHTVAPTETLAQNFMLLLSGLIPARWLCQKRILIENIRNLHGDSNKRIQMNGSPDSLENSLMNFKSVPGNQQVFKLKDYDIHKLFCQIELGVDLTVENGKITAWKRNHATFGHVELEYDEEANRMAWARIARRPNLPWQVIDPRYAHVPDPDQTLTIQEKTNRFHEEMDRIYNTGPSTSSS
ncbi:hypothetical protein CAEBREN_11784 [Caenorhabditis brenneri]|uniref:Uncharacterized protein n=1 Tax=Caenorhabditis brenneri TaxID=135651 RepID=G0NEQ1_CAEBE|nr:hypothetical protein CAEBREN_11784 [Caenorhabditis brenneri]